MKLFYQKVKSEDLEDMYSMNQKVNSVIRTLVALHGTEELFKRVYDFTATDEAKELSSEEVYELYRAAKWAQLFK